MMSERLQTTAYRLKGRRQRQQQPCRLLLLSVLLLHSIVTAAAAAAGFIVTTTTGTNSAALVSSSSSSSSRQCPLWFTQRQRQHGVVHPALQALRNADDPTTTQQRSTSTPPTRSSTRTPIDDNRLLSKMMMNQVVTKTSSVAAVVTSMLLAVMVVVGITTTGAYADELGKETEAPTVFTGETVEICTKRGPLGACLETVQRTADNDNDKAMKYFAVDPVAKQKEKFAARQKEIQEQKEADELAAQQAAADGTPATAVGGASSSTDTGNALIDKLRQQTTENAEKNRLAVARKTFENDKFASFGPFDRQVVIMNTDGKTFTLLENPQAMRLKKDGFIEGRIFVKQPTPAQIDAALQASEEEEAEAGGGGVGGFVQGILGGGGGGDDDAS